MSNVRFWQEYALGCCGERKTGGCRIDYYRLSRCRTLEGPLSANTQELGRAGLRAPGFLFLCSCCSSAIFHLGDQYGLRNSSYFRLFALKHPLQLRRRKITVDTAFTHAEHNSVNIDTPHQ